MKPEPKYWVVYSYYPVFFGGGLKWIIKERKSRPSGKNVLGPFDSEAEAEDAVNEL